eukprot:1339930-Heterocapsa_arctica.AAC.1
MVCGTPSYSSSSSVSIGILEVLPLPLFSFLVVLEPAGPLLRERCVMSGRPSDPEVCSCGRGGLE